LEIDFTAQNVEIFSVPGDELTLIYSGTIKSSWELPEPFILIDINSSRIDISLPKQTYSGTGSFQTDLLLELGIPNNRLADLIISTSSGNIEVSGSPASRILVETKSGDSEVSDFSGYNLRVNSSSGDQDLEKIKIEESVKLTSVSGTIHAEIEKTGNSVLAQSTKGDIEIGIPEDTNYTLSVKAETDGLIKKEVHGNDQNGMTEITLSSETGKISLDLH